MTDEEFKATLATSLQRQDNGSASAAPLGARRSLLALPNSKNWVVEGKVTPVKNQGSVSGMALGMVTQAAIHDGDESCHCQPGEQWWGHLHLDTSLCSCNREYGRQSGPWLFLCCMPVAAELRL